TPQRARKVTRMRCDSCQYLPRLVRHRVRLLQRLRHARAVDAVRVVAAPIDELTLKVSDDERVAPLVM
ncbi:MAG: hypothetical protein RLZZ170_1574, partial [Actinomycetota bacterium]